MGFLGKILADHVKQQLKAQLLDLKGCEKTQRLPQNLKQNNNLEGKQFVSVTELCNEKLGYVNYGQ